MNPYQHILRNYFQKYLPLTNIDPLVEAFATFKCLKKGELFVRPGEKATSLAFICNGTFREYFYTQNGDEITTWFFYGEMFIADLLSFFNGKKSSRYVEAIENSQVLLIEKSALEKLYLTFPEYLDFGKKIAERRAILLMERMLSLQTKSAEERYKELLDHPKLMQNIPLKYLASYLGIKDTSLSRIRKKII